MGVQPLDLRMSKKHISAFKSVANPPLLLLWEVHLVALPLTDKKEIKEISLVRMCARAGVRVGAYKRMYML